MALKRAPGRLRGRGTLPLNDDPGRETQRARSCHGRRLAAGLTVVAGGAELLADGDRRGGYGGSGPAQLALVILLTGRGGGRAIPPAEWGVIAPIEADRWMLYAGDVLGWLESAAGTNDVVRLAEER